jgi:hypothetical protein
MGLWSSNERCIMEQISSCLGIRRLCRSYDALDASHVSRIHPMCNVAEIAETLRRQFPAMQGPVNCWISKVEENTAAPPWLPHPERQDTRTPLTEVRIRIDYGPSPSPSPCESYRTPGPMGQRSGHFAISSLRNWNQIIVSKACRVVVGLTGS